MSYFDGDSDTNRRVRYHNAFNEAYGNEYPQLAELAGAGVDPREILGILKHLQDKELQYSTLGEQGRQFDEGAALKAMLGAGDIASKANLMGMQLEAGKYEKPLEGQKYKAEANYYLNKARIDQQDKQEQGRNTRQQTALDWKEANPPQGRALPQANLDAMQQGLKRLWVETYGKSTPYNPAIGSAIANLLAKETDRTGQPPTKDMIINLFTKAVGPPPPAAPGMMDTIRSLMGR